VEGDRKNGLDSLPQPRLVAKRLPGKTSQVSAETFAILVFEQDDQVFKQAGVEASRTVAGKGRRLAQAAATEVRFPCRRKE
jgi:hypothetical protein